MLFQQLSLELRFTGLEQGIIFPRDSHLRRTGLLVANFEKNTWEVPRPCFVGVAWNLSTPKRYQFKNNTLIGNDVFQLNTQKGTVKAPAVGPIEAKHPKRYLLRYQNDGMWVYFVDHYL